MGTTTLHCSDLAFVFTSTSRAGFSPKEKISPLNRSQRCVAPMSYRHGLPQRDQGNFQDGLGAAGRTGLSMGTCARQWEGRGFCSHLLQLQTVVLLDSFVPLLQVLLVQVADPLFLQRLKQSGQEEP